MEPRLHGLHTLAVGPTKSGKTRWLTRAIINDLLGLPPEAAAFILTPDDPARMHPSDARLSAHWYAQAEHLLRDVRAGGLPGPLLVVRKLHEYDAELVARAADHWGRALRRPALLHYDEASHVCDANVIRGQCLRELAVAYRHRNLGISICAQRVAGMVHGHFTTNAERALLFRTDRADDRERIARDFNAPLSAAASASLPLPTWRPVEIIRGESN